MFVDLMVQTLLIQTLLHTYFDYASEHIQGKILNNKKISKESKIISLMKIGNTFTASRHHDILN